MSIDPETLMAYADGELGPIEAKRVERAIAEESGLAEQVAQHRALRAALGAHFAPVAEEPIPERLAAMLRSNMVALPRRGMVSQISAWTRWGGAVAAALIVGLLLGHGWAGNGLVRTGGGQLYAAGALASALDSQLAANAGAIRTPVSFRDGKGGYCRVFTSNALDGIACRDAQGWALRQTHTGIAAPKSDYAQAGSADAAVMAAAQEMMVGDALDASEEAKARGSGWR